MDKLVTELLTLLRELLAGQDRLLKLALARREAFVMAYGDCFYLLGALLLAMVLLVWFCRRATNGGLAAH